MPFDSAPSVSLNRSLLLNALRSPLINYEWDFETVHRKTKCGAVGCAFGLSQELGIHNFCEGRPFEAAYGVPPGSVRKALLCDFAVETYGVSAAQVTPQMVADKLESVFADNTL